MLGKLGWDFYEIILHKKKLPIKWEAFIVKAIDNIRFFFALTLIEKRANIIFGLMTE